MPENAEDERIPRAFTEKLEELHSKQFDAAGACIQLAAKALALRPETDLQRVTSLLLASMTNSITALGVLCRYGHGSDAILVARGMFESLVTLKYLIARPKDVRDYLDFDWVARWKRMHFYKEQLPETYEGFSAAKTAKVEKEYARVRNRFRLPNGKPRVTWCKHNVSQMAAVAGLTEMYDIFYPYASAIHHRSPMGLGMLVRGDSLQIQPAPQLAHIGVALMLGIHVLVEAIRSQCKLHGIDYEPILKLVEDVTDRDGIPAHDGLGALADIFPDIPDGT